MRKNTRTAKAANIPAEAKDTQSIIEKFTDLAVFDFKTAAVISRFINNGCPFCELTNLCSEGRKRVVLKDSDDDFREVCKDFQLSYSKCERAITGFIKEHPEEKEEAIKSN